MFMSGTPRELEGTRTYVSTGKEPSPYGDNVDLASWMLMTKMDESFGGKPATVSDIYYQVTRPMGISVRETAQMAKVAKSRGYLKWGS